ncbi:MAG: ABC transporter permease [Clostridia bacterium]|nr:ABC transporter permease [Clostridia bacterium]
MKEFLISVKRNTKLFFKDKGLFFTSLITPLILLVLYATFLANVYTDAFNSVFNSFGMTVEEKVMNGLVGGQLMSSLLAVSCVTVSFCSNMLMVQDKVSGARTDMLITPAKRSTLALSYYISTTVSTLIICFLALGACLIYVGLTGWFLTFSDVMLLVSDVFILVTFGTALSSVINFFLSSQGQISAVGSIVSSCYGFICGAYMPLANFGEGLRNAVMFLPGTYGTSLIRNHSINGALNELSNTLPKEAIEGLKDSIDCNLYFFGNQVETWVAYLVMGVTILILIGAYVLLNVLVKRKKK